MTTTLKDVAEACGVSYSTVSKALKNSPLVKPDTKKRIQDQAHKMNYVPNHSARSLVSKKSRTVGLIWPALDRVAVNELIVEINNYLKESNYVMLVSIDDPKAASEKFLEYQCDGIIVFDEGNHTMLSEYIYNNLPVIAYGAKEQLNYPIVNPNHTKAMTMAIDYLIDAGYQEIDYIGPLNTNDSRQITKKKAFIDYCNEKNVSYRTIDSVSLNTFESEREIRKFIKKSPLANGIISSTFDITVGLLNVITPEKHMKIVSYDNISKINTLDHKVVPVGVPTKILAENIVTTLIDKIEGGAVEDTILLTPQIGNSLNT